MASTPILPDLGGAPGSGLPFTVPPMNLEAAALRPGAPMVQRAAPPDYYAPLMSEAGAKQLLMDVRKQCEPGREQFEAGWWRIILYFFGRQWVWYDPNARSWTDRRFAQWIPRPVTNKVREAYDSIASLMADIDLDVSGAPIGNSPINQITADIISSLVPALAHEHKMTSNVMPIADFFAILLGNTFLHPCWDKDQPTHTIQDRMWQCLACQTPSTGSDIAAAKQKCPACGSNALKPMLDATGKPQMTTQTIGAGKTLVVSPLELLFPTYAQSFEAVDRLVYTTWLPRHEIEDLAPDTAARVAWANSPQQRSLQLYRAIGYQSDLPMPTQSTFASNAPAAFETEGATIQYLWVRACKRYPQGVYLPFIGEGDSAIPAWELIAPSKDASTGGGAVGAGSVGKPTIPYTTAKGSALWPWVHYPYKPVGARLLAQGAMDPVLQKQDQINQIDSMTDLTVKRMGNPVWLEEKGSQVERFTGMPGMVIKWTRVGQSGGEPKRIEGQNPPQSFFSLRQQYLGDFEEATGTYDVVKGAKPSGVAAYSALQLLVERSQSRFNISFKARGEAYRQWAEIAFELERKYGPTERVRNVMGPNRRWTQHVFTQADLQGQISILVEDGSSSPKTSLGKRAALEHANQMGLLDFTQPDQKLAALNLIGCPELVPGLDTDVMSALSEQQAVQDWAAENIRDIGALPFIRMPWHDDATHFEEHRKWMNGDEAKEILSQAMQIDPNLANAIIQKWGAHLAEHESMMLKRQMVDQLASHAGATMAAGGPQRGADGGGVGAGRAMHDSNRQASDGPPPAEA